MAKWDQNRTRRCIGVRSSNVTSGQAAVEIIVAAVPVSGTSSASPGTFLMEVRICMAAATESTFGLGVPAAKGITPTTPVFLVGEDVAAAYTTSTRTSTALAWGTSPTNPTVFHRRAHLPATIGVEQVFVFKNGIYIAPNTTFVVQNLASNGVADICLVVEEA